MKVLKESIGTVLDIDSLLDILNGETLSDVGSALANGTRNKEGYSSIASRANELTATFPILISNRVSLKTAEKIQKALEFRYALMLQMVIASRSFTTSKDAVDFLKNYHTNIDAGSWRSIGSKILSTTDEAAIYEMAARKAINEAYAQNGILNENAKPIKLQAFQEKNAFVDIRKFINALHNEDRNTVKAVGDMLQYKQTQANNAQTKLKDELERNRHERNLEDMDASDLYAQREEERRRQQHLRNNEDYQNKTNLSNLISKNKVNTAQKVADINYNAKKQMLDLDKKAASEREKITPLSRPQLNDQKVRKANALNPLTMNVNFKVKASNEAIVTVEAMIGVKTKLYPVDSMEIMERIYSNRRTKINLFNFIRAFSGEIQFWRDFVFALGKAKIDANFNARRVGSKLWKVLERRSKTSKISQMLNINNAATAITTLVISMEEVEFLNKEADIDLLDAHEARKILNDFNFISIMIVDENLETIRTILDTGNDEWESNTFKAFDRDEEMDYKQMVKMLAKAY